MLWAAAEQEGPPFDEEEVVGGYVTWTEARKSLGSAKLSRRFPKGVPRPKSTQRRVKCWNCGTVGHFSKDCPKPRRPRGKGEGKGKGKGKRAFWLDGGDGDGGDGDADAVGQYPLFPVDMLLSSSEELRKAGWTWLWGTLEPT